MTAASAQLLSQIINRYKELSAPSLSHMLENAVAREYVRDEYLFREGKACTFEYFLLEGILQSTVYNDAGDCITTGFYTGGMVLTPHFARMINGRSVFSVQALSDAVVAEMPVTVLDSLRYSFHDIKQFGLKVVEQELLKTIQHDIGFRAMSARQRLLSFREHFPALENKIPHTIIASYLGITPVSFSRLRNELAKQ